MDTNDKAVRSVLFQLELAEAELMTTTDQLDAVMVGNAHMIDNKVTEADMAEMHALMVEVLSDVKRSTNTRRRVNSLITKICNDNKTKD